MVPWIRFFDDFCLTEKEKSLNKHFSSSSQIMFLHIFQTKKRLLINLGHFQRTTKQNFGANFQLMQQTNVWNSFCGLLKQTYISITECQKRCYFLVKLNRLNTKITYFLKGILLIKILQMITDNVNYKTIFLYFILYALYAKRTLY